MNAVNTVHAVGSPTVIGAHRPLEAVDVQVSGPAALTAPALAHLRSLGAGAPETPAARTGPARFTATGGGLGEVTAYTAWADVLPEADANDEATVQAATGMMHVHGRRDGAPRGLAVDYAATCASVLTVQGLLAALLGRARGGGGATDFATGADRAALLTVSQYAAAANAPEAEAVTPAPGGPPFTAACGTRFELEALEPAPWARFWRALGAPEEAIRAGWPPFQFRYATACAPLPEELHRTARAVPWRLIREAAASSGAEVCALHTLAGRAAEAAPDAAPWTLATFPEAGTPPLTAGALSTGPLSFSPLSAGALPLSGLTVLEAGRRIQAPLAAHLLGLLGADVVRIEPPGGDPLRGMPPCAAGVSARWLALNRGKRAVEVDIKSPVGQAELRELAAGADVFLHNWAPGKAERFGLGAGHLAPVNPRLVYAYTSGWAGRLPDAPMGTDFMVQARTAVGEAARPADEPPAPSLMTLIDVLGGLVGAEAVLAGLLLRERSGRGVRVESSLLGAAETLTAPAVRRAAAGQGPRRPAGFRRPLATADGWLAPADDSSRTAHAESARLRELPSDQAVAALRAQGGSATAVTTDLGALPEDPRLRGALTRDSHGSLVVPSPWRFA
ncbi:CoA-transferase family III [Streptomyces sp. 2112.3]|nr:CoA transferase family III [Streptomyces sp. 2321.6]SDR57974.1 CoA-transferase family III [Streptomyces sp. KS_16]SEB80911.1 CoA-transferase family III [Streptomyces sp. 2133.1]SEF13844.1 CoA-transferase family III [Streptomyces sp. 2112.3]SNC61196.1 CoA-transferase family III [Streptomyces sp. 2114.4]